MPPQGRCQAPRRWPAAPHADRGRRVQHKPDNLNPGALGTGLKEDGWKDLFIAWAPNGQVSVTATGVDLGAIVPAIQPRRQTSGDLSLQLIC